MKSKFDVLDVIIFVVVYCNIFSVAHAADLPLTFEAYDLSQNETSPDQNETSEFMANSSVTGTTVSAESEVGEKSVSLATKTEPLATRTVTKKTPATSQTKAQSVSSTEKTLPSVVGTAKTTASSQGENTKSETANLNDKSSQVNEGLDLDDDPEDADKDVNDTGTPNMSLEKDVSVKDASTVVKLKAEAVHKQDATEEEEKTPFPEQENNHFFAYFLTVVTVCILGYFLLHNKQKIIALIVEGRHGRKRRLHSYRKLESEGSKGSQPVF